MADMYIVCKKCGYRDTLNKRFILKVMGATFAGGGFWAWVTFFFAGTGFALPICIALVSGGVTIAAFSDEIAEWVSKRFTCTKSHRKEWKVEKD